ncbi:fimbrial protein [Pantoea sp. BAV 3049]|uniref:fimbrial protein n=1 Tax=Pantoea sp. BAV 3049 TaxID=2654188 RepID=UPI00131D098C|nr:fimbrial protein [Pantoea sp. BAV 3049]
MNLNKLAVALGMGMIMVAGAAVASDTPVTDSTHVYFDGTITNAPCSLTPDSQDQHVAMGSIAAHLLKDGGTSDAHPFHFELTNCDTSTINTVAVTFGGASDSNASDLLSLGSGEASGAGIVILADGKPVTLGSPTAAQTLTDGDNTLTFAAQLKGDGASAVTPGAFSAVSDVTFTYQ